MDDDSLTLWEEVAEISDAAWNGVRSGVIMSRAERMKKLWEERRGEPWPLNDSALQQVLAKTASTDPDDYVLRDMDQKVADSYQGGH